MSDATLTVEHCKGRCHQVAAVDTRTAGATEHGR
jgi:hypothetical protein